LGYCGEGDVPVPAEVAAAFEVVQPQAVFANYMGPVDQDFWEAPIGDETSSGIGTACFGHTGCQMAYIHLLETGDIEGSKQIAALYCVDHLDQCGHNARMDDLVHNLEFDALNLIALGMAGAGRGKAASGKGTGCLNSFAGDTLVLMADGTSKPIDEVRVGDEVANAEPDSDKTQRHTVTALHVTDGDRDFVDVSVGTPAGPKSITTTAHHLFWDATTHAWTNAADLKFGHKLNTPGDGHVTVLTLRRYTAAIRTYNLTIDTVHTYYVEAGTSPVLVHNCPEDLYSIEDHVKPRHIAGGAEAEANKSLFDSNQNLERLAEGSAGQIGIRQAETGSIRYVINAKQIVGVDRAGNSTSTYTIIPDGVDGELITMHPGLPSDIAPGG
jgi:hypothetical protein